MSALRISFIFTGTRGAEVRIRESWIPEKMACYQSTDAFLIHSCTRGLPVTPFVARLPKFILLIIIWGEWKMLSTCFSNKISNSNNCRTKQYFWRWSLDYITFITLSNVYFHTPLFPIQESRSVFSLRFDSFLGCALARNFEEDWNGIHRHCFLEEATHILRGLNFG